VIIFDDDIFVLNMLSDFFLIRGYEVLSSPDPAALCPLAGKESAICMKFYPCADVLITDCNMSGVNGIELLERQTVKNCKIECRNKAVISGFMDLAERKRIKSLGCTFFQKPFPLSPLTEWLIECEQRMDLLRPLASRRREVRRASGQAVTYRISHHGELRTGVALNVSNSGLCLRVVNPLKPDDWVRIYTDLGDRFHAAAVRWVKKADGGGYLAGLRYC
jgi:CheY-like chemotaxis protein